MNHEELKDKLHALHDGELSSGERAELLAHLAACSACRSEQERWKHIAGAFLRAAPSPAEGETERFTARVMARIHAEIPEETAAPWSWAGLRWMAPALGFALATAFLLAIWPGPEFPAPEDVAVLTEGEAGGLAAWVSEPAAPTTDDLLAVALGEI
jgi:anti-sigma factor RsiW